MGDKISSNKDKLQEMVAERRFQDAVRLARLTLLSTPQDIDSRLLLAKSLMSLARYDDVLAEAQVALELDESRGEAWTLKGEALFFKGAYSKALASLNKAKKLFPNDKKVNRLIDEIQLTQDPDEDTGSLEVDTSATKSYPMEDTGELEEELEGDPTEIMDVPPVTEASADLDAELRAEEEAVRVEDKKSKQKEAAAPSPASQEVDLERQGDFPSESEQDHQEELSPPDTAGKEKPNETFEEHSEASLLSVGDSTALEELSPSFSQEEIPEEVLRRSEETKELDLNDLEAVGDQKDEEDETSQDEVSTVQHRLSRPPPKLGSKPKAVTDELDLDDLEDIDESEEAPTARRTPGKLSSKKSQGVEHKRPPRPSPARQKASRSTLENIDDFDDEEETDARGAVVKFISPEKLVTVEQVAVTTGEIAGRRFRLEEETQEESRVSTVEFRADKTRSLKPHKAEAEGEPQPRISMEEPSPGSSPNSPGEEDLDDVKTFSKRKIQSKKERPKSKAALS